MNRTDVINYIAETKGYKTYLEIGVQTLEQNFNKIKVPNKTGVDPKNSGKNIKTMLSDAFFASNKATYDLIFIDGDHSHTQSTKDFENALKCLTEGGCIIMHDVVPDNDEYTKPHWCGEVWKTAVNVANNFDVRTFKKDHGVLVVFPEFTASNAHDVKSYPGQKGLEEILNGVDDLYDLIPSSGEPKIETVEGGGLEDKTDDELKAIYKELKGSGYRGKFNRKTCIKKILEMGGDA